MAGRNASPSSDAALLELVRVDGITTTTALCEGLGLGRTVVSQRISALIERGLLTRGGLAPSTGGRSARELAFAETTRSVIGVEVGVTHVRAGICDLGGRVLTFDERPWIVTDGPDATLQTIISVVRELQDSTPDAPIIAAMGVGIPAPVDFTTGRPTAPPILAGWHDYPLRERLEEVFDVPVWVDNEVNMMALGELRAGAAAGVRDFIFVKLGTGIGSGIVSEGKLHRGMHGAAGDIAHICIDPHSERWCRCGKNGCLQVYAGGAGIARRGNELAASGGSPMLARALADHGDVHAEDVSAAAWQGDTAAIELLREAGASLGFVLAGLANFFNPSVVIIGGGVSRADPFLLPAVKSAIQDRAVALAARDLEVRTASYANEAGVVGAALTAVDELLSGPELPDWGGSRAA